MGEHYIGELQVKDLGEKVIYIYKGLVCMDCKTEIGSGTAIVPKGTKFNCPACNKELKCE